jgi:hypothetical protein
MQQEPTYKTAANTSNDEHALGKEVVLECALNILEHQMM